METVNEVLSKLGIYDLIVVLFTGVIICTLTVAMVIMSGFGDLFSIFTSESFESYTPLIFLISSYFIGLMFQEIGSYEQRGITNKDNKLLRKALHTEDNSYIFMTEKECKSVFEYVAQKIDCQITNPNSQNSQNNQNWFLRLLKFFHLIPNFQNVQNNQRLFWRLLRFFRLIPDPEDNQEYLNKYHINMIYNYCRYYVVKNLDTSRLDRDQSLAAMSRSLHVYFLAVSIFTGIFFVAPCFLVFFIPIYLYLFIISLAISILMYLRSRRLAKLRYIYVFRLFYYFVVKKDQDDLENSSTSTGNQTTANP